MKTKRPSLNTLRLVRKRVHTDLLAHRHVVGTAIGEKISSDRISGQRALIVYVTKKMRPSRLKGELLPKSVRVNGNQFLVDVIEVGDFRRQFGPAPHFCSDGFENGTVTAMCTSGEDVFAATCAHNLKGIDFDIYTKDRMLLFHPDSQAWVEIGNSSYVQYSTGFGVSGDYGFTDAGLFTIEDQGLLQRCRAAEVLPSWRSVRTGVVVWAKASGGRVLRGTVVHVEQNFEAFFADVCIQVASPGSFAGDSGVLWRTESGLGVAIHARGSGDYGDGGAKYSYGMFAHRMEDVLGVTFLDLGS